jgi:FkbM family methyltransferase
LLSPIFENSSEELAYWRLCECGFQPGGIIDIGAYVGEWTAKTRRFYPAAPILMIEAQESKQTELEAVSRSTGADLCIATLGEAAGQKLTFYEMKTGSSLLPERSDVARTERQVTTETLDTIVSGWKPELSCLFVKIDVQGAELMVLSGGPKTLARTEILQLELPLLSYNEGAPDLMTILSWLNERGLVPFDIAGTHRPYGCQPSQLDLLFARKDSAFRLNRFDGMIA